MKDLIAELERMRRTVGSQAPDDGPAHVVELRRTYDAPPEDVWDARTSPERIARWFLPVTGDLRHGGRFQLEGNAGGEIVECEPPQRLAVTWEFGGQASLLTLELAPGEGSIELGLRHAAQRSAAAWGAAHAAAGIEPAIAEAAAARTSAAYAPEPDGASA